MLIFHNYLHILRHICNIPPGTLRVEQVFMDAMEHCLETALTPQVMLSWSTALRTLIAVEAPLVDMVVAGRALGKPPPSPAITLRVTATLRGIVERAMVRQQSSFSIAAVDDDIIVHALNALPVI